MPSTLAELSSAFHAQASNAVRWIEFLGDDVAGHAQDPSALDGWSVRDLMVHIGGCMDTLITAQPAPAGTIPLTLAEYLGTYPNRAQEITDLTHQKSNELQVGLAQYVAQQYADAEQAIAAAGTDDDLVMQGRRGPISLRDLVASRLIEVVVHTIDLVYSLHGKVDMSGQLNPLDRAALRLTAAEFLDIVITRGGYSLEVTDAELWVRLAAGRTPYNTADLTRAIKPTYTAGGVPDLGRALPVL